MKKIVLSVFTVLMLCFQLAAQNQRVTGTVTDAASGEPVMGAVVTVMGTTTAVVTGLNGEYSINVPDNAVLKFEFLGFAEQEIAVAPGQTVINVKLLEDNQQIEQVVVVGYGTARSIGSVTGSVSVVDADILNDKPVMNVADALSGQVSGMSVMTSSGEPSAGSSIKIHGSGSISAGTEPLYVIDGMPSSSNQFLAMNSNDIESMVTLKDASATSIYGSRAANGVIYITTKKGSRKDQDAQFRFSGSYGISSPVNNRYKPMGATDLLKWQYYFDELSSENYQKYEALLKEEGATDWFKYIYQNRPTYNAEFAIQGGSERINYYVSGSYMNQDGMAPGSNMERYTVRTNLSAQANSWLRINMNMSLASTQSETTMGQYGPTGALNPTSTTNFPFYMPSYMTKFYYDEETGARKQYSIFPNGFGDPFYIMEKAPSSTNSHYLNGNIALVITPIKGLTISSVNGIDGAYSTFWGNNLPSHIQANNSGSRNRSFSQYYTLSTSNTIEYKFEPIRDFHNITLLVGQEGIDYYDDAFEVITSGQSDDRLMLLPNGTDITMDQVGEANNSYNMLSFFGRVNYEYKNKYAVDVTLRNDASSRFGSKNRNALFYAVGGMWNVREEFFKDSRVVTDLRLRLTYGTQGNSAISNYAHLSLIAGGITYAGKNGKYFASVGNDHLGWEKQGLWNLSVEAGLFNWLELTASFYNRKTTDLLYDMPYPPSSGITSRGENILKMLNRGVDIDINATLFHNRDWNITFSTTFGYNYNIITDLYAANAQPIAMPDSFGMFAVGRSAWAFYMPVFMGVDPRDGAPMYDDGNGNPIKDANQAAHIRLDDKQFIAPYNGGFNLNASWKGLSLQANFAYQLDKWLVNGSRYFLENTVSAQLFQRPESMKNIWHEKGQITNIPKYGETSIYSDAYLENASYLRLKNLSLSYQLPQSILRKTGFIKGLKVSAIFRNLWTLTNYSGFDPEFNGNIVYGMYPNSRQYSFGLELTF